MPDKENKKDAPPSSSPFSGYLEKIRDRGKNTRIKTKHQMIGLEIADLLGDRRHKALYMKLAKEEGGDLALTIAKTVAENGNVKNKGAYFMKVWSESKKDSVKSKNSKKTGGECRGKIKAIKNETSDAKKRKIGDLEALDAFL